MSGSRVNMVQCRPISMAMGPYRTCLILLGRDTQPSVDQAYRPTLICITIRKNNKRQCGLDTLPKWRDDSVKSLLHIETASWGRESGSFRLVSGSVSGALLLFQEPCLCFGISAYVS